MNFSDINGSAIYSLIVSKLRGAGCVFAEDEALLLISSAQTTTDLAILVDRRTTGFPLEHILGWVEFCGLRIELDQGVFVPRHRTEFLVQQAATLTQPGAVVVDLCCGSGAVGAALVAMLERIELYSVDIDPVAVRCARRNINSAGGQVYEGDLYDPLPTLLHGRVHVIVANAPYVPTEAMKLLPLEARIHEARVALDGGSDGLNVQRRIVAAVSLWLVESGYLLVETSEAQAPMTAKIFAQYGLLPKLTRSDEKDATVVIGTKTALVN